MSTRPKAAIVLSTTACTSAAFETSHSAPSTVKPRAAHVGDGRRQPLVAARAQHQRRAGFGEPFGHLLSEAARSAGDDRDAAVEI